MTATATRTTGRQRTTALVLATFALTTNFWAWGLLSPLAPDYRDVLGLSAFQTSILVATPVLLGSLFRIPVGALTDRFGGRAMFTGLSLAVTAPLLFLATFRVLPRAARRRLRARPVRRVVRDRHPVRQPLVPA